MLAGSDCVPLQVLLDETPAHFLPTMEERCADLGCLEWDCCFHLSC